MIVGRSNAIRRSVTVEAKKPLSASSVALPPREVRTACGSGRAVASVGVVGAGLMGQWHARAAVAARARVSAVVDSDIQQARALARKYSTARAFSRVDEMLARESLDVLHICSPSSTHAAIAEMAIDSGINLFVEKPLAPTAHLTARLYDLAEQRGLLLCPVHQYVFQNGVKKVQQLMPSLGRLIHIGAYFRSAGGVGLSADKVDAITTDILPHPLSLMQHFLPAGISNEGWTTIKPAPGEIRVLGESSNTTLSIFVSMNGRPTLASMEIVGTNGTIHLNLFHGYAYIESGRVSRARKILHPFETSFRNFSAASANLCRRAIAREFAYPGLVELVGSFYNAITTGRPAPISRQDAMAVALVRDYMSASSKSVGHATAF